MTRDKKLFEEFPPVETAEWMNKLVCDLKGADLYSKLVWKTGEGFEVKPFYRKEDLNGLPYMSIQAGQFPYIRGIKKEGNNWYIRQNLEVYNYREANRKAVELLNSGVDSLGFRINKPGTINRRNFELLLTGIDFQNNELNFLSEGGAREIVEILLNLPDMAAIDHVHLKGAIEADPLGRLMLNGRLCVPLNEGLDYLASLVNDAAGLPGVTVIQVNASDFINAGAGITEELAYGISCGCEYLAQLTERGIATDLALKSIRFSFGISSNYFFEIAKLRAARLLWSAVATGFMPSKEVAACMKIHSVTGRWNKTRYDPYVNLLRTQTEAMSAILGGTDSLTVEPFDAVLKDPDEFSERLARNQQLLLKEESHFARVADPSAGSYYIEMLTVMIAESSWKLFLEMEEKGGFLEVLRSGDLQKRIKESSSQRKSHIASRKTKLVGTNLFPENNEVIKAGKHHDLNMTEERSAKEKIIEPVEFSRGAYDIERLRIAADNAPERPSVFILPLGDPVMSAARSQFSTGFFACGGYKVIENTGFGSVDEGVDAAIKSDAAFVVICSSDEEYAELVPQIYDRIKDKAEIVVAGNPSSAEDLRRSGIRYFISVHSDIVDTIEQFHKLAGLI